MVVLTSEGPARAHFISLGDTKMSFLFEIQGFTYYRFFDSDSILTHQTLRSTLCTGFT